MANLHSMTHRIPIAAARKHFASIVRQTKGGERIKLTRYNKTIAAIIPKHDLEKLTDCEAQEEPSAKPKPKSR